MREWVGLSLKCHLRTEHAQNCTSTCRRDAIMASWERVESRKHKGKFYYFNRATGESVWKVPESLKSEKEASNGVGVGTQKSSVTNGWETKTQATLKPSKPTSLEVSLVALQSNSNNSVAGGASARTPQTPLQVKGKPAREINPAPLVRTVSGGCSDGGEMEEMEYERWGGEEEVAMDVDLSEEEQLGLISQVLSARSTLTPSASLDGWGLPQETINYSESLYIVLDTNVLLAHLTFLVELKDYAIKGVGRPVLVVPWAVMQELDALKSRGSVGGRARTAISFLNSCFSARHPRVRGQTLDEVHTEVQNMAIANNDDRILHCCLLYQLKVKAHQGVVVLFSNDIQLCSKAMINDIKAVNRKTLLSDLRLLCKSSKTSSYTHTQEYAVRLEQQLTVEEKKRLADDLLCEAESLVREGLAAAVKAEMLEAYGEDLWTVVVAVKPPWGLKDLVHLLDKHWVAVFGLVLQSSMRDVISSLQKHVRYRNGMLPTFKDVQYFLQNGLAVLRAFPAKPDNGQVLSHCTAGLTVLLGKLDEAKSSKVSHLPPTSPTLARSKPSPPTLAPLIPPPSSQLGGMRDSLHRLAHTPPSNPGDHLQWVLRLVFETLQYCHSQLLENLQKSSLASARAVASQFLAQLCELLSRVTTTLSNLLTLGVSIPRMQEALAAFDVFLQHVLMVPSPLTLDQFYLLSSSRENSQLLQSALQEYNSFLSQLQAIATTFNL